LADIGPGKEAVLAPPTQSSSARTPDVDDISHVTSQLSSFLLRETAGDSLTLGGISEEDFEKANEKALVDTAGFPKWEGMRRVPMLSFS
jgi:hypothetical protein